MTDSQCRSAAFSGVLCNTVSRSPVRNRRELRTRTDVGVYFTEVGIISCHELARGIEKGFEDVSVKTSPSAGPAEAQSASFRASLGESERI